MLRGASLRVTGPRVAVLRAVSAVLGNRTDTKTGGGLTCLTAAAKARTR